tara:strand:+ start:204 stop:626 length:423 start_codon:yes stop_codon:yes gene_type:complete
MASKGNWTVIFEDKKIVNQSVLNSDDWGTGYTINDDSFWNDPKWSNIWAVQYKEDNHDYNDSVEYKDETPHATWASANLGDFRTLFIDKWDVAHLEQIQTDWDNSKKSVEDPESSDTWRWETAEEKIIRLGERPTSYTTP